MNKITAYSSFFKEIIDTINSARYQCGQSIVETLSKDINKQIDGVKGYSPQNLWRMRQFYLEYKDEPKLLELALKIPWGQNMLIIRIPSANYIYEMAIKRFALAGAAVCEVG